MDDAAKGALLERVALGDRAAFERLYQTSSPRLHAIALRVLKDREAAAEALEDAFVKIWRYAERFPAAGVRPIVFMAAIVRHLSIERLRAREAPGRSLEAARNLAAGRRKADEKALRRLAAGAPLADALTATGEGETLRVAYFGAAPMAELAAREGLAVSAVRARLCTALARLAGSQSQDDLDAFEYVLALHDAATRRTFELALLDDPALASAVWRAETALMPLAAALPVRKPPARIWRGVRRKAFGGGAARGAGERRTARGSLALWRTVATFAALAAVAGFCLVAVLILRPEAVLPPEPADSVAALVTPTGAVTLARVSGDGTLHAEPFAADPLAEGRTAQLWLVPQAGAPQSVGLLKTDAATRLESRELAAAPSGARLEITEEPAGGSPTGRPTGTVLAQGTLRRI